MPPAQNPPPPAVNWLRKLRTLIPTRDQLATGRWTRWLAPWLGRQRLWRFSRHGVALGVAIGVFFGLLIPIAQIPASAAAAILLRANLPAAMGSTLVTNPVTFAPIYFMAYKTGRRLTGEPVPRGPEANAAIEAEIARLTRNAQAQARASGSGSAAPTPWQRLRAMGKPLILGLSIFAVAGSALAYALITALLWLWQRLKWRRRRHALAQQQGRQQQPPRGPAG